MTSPIPGVTYPNPRTWFNGDIITSPRLRGDFGNLASIFVGARPILSAQDFTNETLNANAITPLTPTTANLNNWNTTFASSGTAASTYPVPMAGWYLLQVSGNMSTGTSSNANRWGFGFRTVINGAGAANVDGGMATGDGNASGFVGTSGAELQQLSPTTTDTVTWYAFTSQTPGPVGIVENPVMSAEWVGLPTSGITSYTGPYGTVVNPPAAVAGWPPTAGTTLTSPASAGATSIVVADATGMVVGAQLGLDYYNGMPSTLNPEVTAITSIAGLTIGTAALRYGHASGANVAVPVSQQFLNQQMRDLVNFLAYPPMLRVGVTAIQSIPSGGFPTGTQITNLSTSGSGTGVDNFSGFSSNAYTVPVGGVYYVYGQVYYAGANAVSDYAAGITINGGTTQWGVVQRAPAIAATPPFCSTFCRHITFSAGDVVKLFGFQNSGGAMNTVHSTVQNSRLIMIWRGIG